MIATDAAKVTMPVLTIHGTADRAVPYGAGREWAFILPNAKLLTIEEGGHLSWIEEPERVLDAVKTFLSGRWPKDVERIGRVDPKS